MSVTEACSDPSFCCELVGGTPSLRGNHAYYFQVQGQMAISGVKWCDFFFWIGLSSHSESIYADGELWVKTIQTRLAAFYDKHARPYLSAKSRPTPPAAQSQGSSTAGIVNHPEQWELLLPVGQSQSTIRGRNGSNSCTIISALFVRQCSSGTSNDQPDFSPQSCAKL